MNDLEKFKKHLGKPIPINIKNNEGEEDTFYFKPLNIEQQAILMELTKEMKKRPEIEVEGKKVPDVSKEDLNNMFELILDVVKNSYPELDNETAKEFTNNNFDQLSNNMDKLITMKENTSIDLIKKRKEVLSDAKSNTESKE